MQGPGFRAKWLVRSDRRQCRPSFLQLLLPKLVKAPKGHMTLTKFNTKKVQGLRNWAVSLGIYLILDP